MPLLPPKRRKRLAAVAVSEAYLVGVVEVAEECYLVSVPETVEVEGAGVAVIGSVAGFGGAEPSLVHVLFECEVDDSLVFSVIDSCEPGHIAFSVNYLEFVDEVGGKVFGSYLGIVAEKFLSVDKEFADGFSVGCD